MQAGVTQVSLPLQTDMDLSSFQSGTLTITRPDGSRGSAALSAANVVAPASQGLIQYTVATGDFPVDGIYTLQVADTTSGRNIPFAPVSIYVEPNP